LEHNLTLSDIRLHLEQAANVAGVGIETWLDYVDLRASWKTERVMIQLGSGHQAENVAIAPDGYVVLTTGQGRGHFFLEFDRGTETIGRQWKRKVLAYKAYLTSGRFHARYGVPAHVGFRVLTVVPSLGRARSLLRAAQQFGPPEVENIFMFADLTAVLKSDLTTPIWLRPGVASAQALVAETAAGVGAVCAAVAAGTET
jgi:hypothetical protein